MQLWYTCSLFLGSGLAEMNMVIDTGSNWTIVGGSDCSTCVGTTWDYASSTTYVDNSGITSGIDYSTYSVSGFTASETVCLLNDDATTCTTGADVFIV